MIEKPRILVLFGSAAIFGAERGNLEALAALKAQGAEILCLIRDEAWSILVPPALDARGIAWRKVPYLEQWRRSRAHVVLLRGPYAILRANRAFLRAIREFKPTHIHAYGQLFVLNFLPGLLLVDTPLVYRAGDEPTFHNWFWRASWRYVVKRTVRFVANSRFIANSLIARGVSPARIELIYNKPPTRVGTKMERLDLPVEGRIIGFIGQIAEHKGPHILIKAFKAVAPRFPDVRLVIAGRIDITWEGDAWARALQEAAMADPDIKDRVYFLGLIENVPALVEQCAFVVVPSLFADPAPNVVMEAKQAARASIVFPRGGLTELVEHDVDGVVCREPTAAILAEALESYLSDHEKVRQHGASARASLTRLGVPHFAERWGEVYRAALADLAPRHAAKTVG